ncbi:MAG TPA: zf-HC2 domain-containing protein [Gemmatimonadaceae bacterium]|nr:zf-HC2 domain-containing protein [Gemmatimonadaceae bacterium]
MMCREFRDLHPAFLDDTLSAHDVVEMQLHLTECARCSRYDTVMRRGLLVLRNLPAVEPSADFLDRLNKKLVAAREVDARAEVFRGPGVGSFLATAASVVVVGFLAAIVFDVAKPARDLRLPPVVAVRPPMAPSAPPAGVNSAFVASASMGLPVWPAAMMAEQAQEHFAAEELGR